MSLVTKYQPVVALMKELEVQDLHYYEEMGELRLCGKLKSNEHRELIISKIREVNNDSAWDISYDLKI